MDSIYKDPVLDLVKEKLDGENLGTCSLLGSFCLCYPVVIFVQTLDPIRIMIVGQVILQNFYLVHLPVCTLELSVNLTGLLAGSWSF